MKKKHKKQKRPELPGSRVKLRFKRHLVPPLVGLLMAFLILGFFDAQLLSSQIASYIQSKHSSSGDVSKQISQGVQPYLIINSINVHVPVTFETNDSATVFLKDLQKGVVHYPGTALPGQEGNIVIFGQSGDRWWAPGQYKFVFAQLSKLKIGDELTLYYQGNRYSYQMYDSGTVASDDLTPINQSSSHILTLITAAPLGSNSDRFSIRANQTFPEVGNDFTSDKSATLPKGALPVLPGNSQAFWQELAQRL